MALKPCSECKREISSDANPCPACGKKSPHGPSAVVVLGGGFLTLLVFGLGVMQMAAPLSGPNGALVEAAESDVEQKIARDAVAEYEIAKRSGDATQTCAHAGMVTAAFLQAQDEANYRRWLQTEKDDCNAAGSTR